MFDWTDGSWHTSRTIRVQPGDKIESYVVYNGAAENSYTMYIASNGQSVTTKYTLLKAQHLNESTAYFVLEHQPNTCRAYPADGVCTFSNIAVAVDGQTVTPQWTAAQEKPACSSKATIVDPATIKFTWDASVSDDRLAADMAPAAEQGAFSPRKWQEATSRWLQGRRAAGDFA